MFGVNEDGGPASYIGMSGDVLGRLKAHLMEKEFWTDVVIFTAKDESVSTALAGYLESRLIQDATKVGRYKLENGNKPEEPILHFGDKDCMEDYLDNLAIVLAALGHDPLRPFLPSDPERAGAQPDAAGTLGSPSPLELTFNGAKAVRTPDGFVVRKGSPANVPQKSMPKAAQRERDHLLEAGVLLQREDGAATFDRDHSFPSAYAAARMVAVTNMNGRSAWRASDGRTLGEIEDAEIQPLDAPAAEAPEVRATNAALAPDAG